MPGYEVEWKSKSVTSKESSVNDRHIEEMHSHELTAASQNKVEYDFKTPLERIVVASILKNKSVQKHTLVISHVSNVIGLTPHQLVVAGDGRHDPKQGDSEGTRLAGQSLDIATVAIFIIAIGIVIAVLGISETIILGGEEITALIIGLILGMILGFVSFFEGIKAMRLTADDPNLKEKHSAAVTAVILGAVAAAVIAVPILIILVLSLLQI